MSASVWVAPAKPCGVMDGGAERTWARPSGYEAKLHATDERPQSVIVGRAPEGDSRRVLKGLPRPVCGRWTPETKAQSSGEKNPGQLGGNDADRVAKGNAGRRRSRGIGCAGSSVAARRVRGLHPGKLKRHQPLTPPAVRPPTIHFWQYRNTRVIGRPDSTAAAAKSPHR